MTTKLLTIATLAAMILGIIAANLPLALVMAILTALTTWLFIVFFSLFKFEIKELRARIPEPEEYKKAKEDIKTLYQNQQLLLSLVNAVRVRINNFYAKKLKQPKLKSAGFETTEEFGEAKDGI